MQIESKEQARERIESLRKSIEEHNWRYHSLDAPIVSDYEYDLLFKELVELEARFPELQDVNSPSRKVGSLPAGGLETKAHSQRMYSLDNVFSNEDWTDFIEKIQRLTPAYMAKDLQFWLEPKMDGLAMELIYENGELTQAITRGDGEKGELVTANMRTVKNIPLRLRTSKPPKLLEVRGEVVISKADFILLNQQQEEEGKKVFANPRNAASGSVRQLDSSITAKRPLRFIAYGISAVPQEYSAEWKTQEELILSLQKLGFSIAIDPFLSNSAHDVVAWFERLEEKRHSLPYDIDGGVAKLNTLSLQEKLGYTAHAPRFAAAWKFAAAQAKTKLLDIQVNVGRTGVLTPLAIFEPVQVGGVTVSKASLHNEDELRAKDVRIGDTVLVQRAGDVIPELVSVLLEERTPDSQVFVFPTHCPSCQQKVHKFSGEVAWRCINPSCPAIIKESILYFVSKAGLDIRGLGKKWVETFIAKGLVRSPSDLFCLQKNELLQLDRMGEKSAANILAALEEGKNNVSMEALLSALGIRHVGRQIAKLLARHFSSIDLLAEATVEDLCQLQDVGPEVARAIYTFFREEENKILLHNLKELGVWPRELDQASGVMIENPFFAGKSFLFTGTLHSLSRQEAEKLVEARGGIVRSSVSKQLNYLVVGSEPGSKLTKAEQLAIQILDEQEFLQKLN